MAEQSSWVPLPYWSPPRCPFPIKSLALSAHVSSWTIHFQVLDKSPLLGPGRGTPSCNKWQLWWGLFSTATDILTTWGTQGPACPPMNQTQNKRLLISLPFPFFLLLNPSYPILPFFLVPQSGMQGSGRRASAWADWRVITSSWQRTRILVLFWSGFW